MSSSCDQTDHSDNSASFLTDRLKPVLYQVFSKSKGVQMRILNHGTESEEKLYTIN